ncbi:MAG: PIG-L family deacetylase [Chitinophagaceae bacterium]|nr:PIG-L family deacetylase [Chitinophagaceae bacterium]
MKKMFLLLTVLTSISSLIRAQAPVSWTSADMYHAIRKLQVLGSVLYIAAHPDDENTRLITYLSKDRMLRTGYLSLTRGDGGQNLIGEEQGIELGLIRTQELLAARRVDGGEQFFTRAYDFGFSKNPEETFNKWDKEKILADVVWVIRKFQPDVIINRFPVTGEGGHGHHTASGILANEAYAAAADPNRFPEQLQFVKVWQAKRVLWNTFNFGGTNTTREDQYKVDVGGYNPLLGKSYGEIAAESRSQHKSQGFGVPATRGESLEYFKATKGDQPSNDLMDGVDLSWNRIPGGDRVAAAIESLARNFDLLHPEKTVEGLVKLDQLMSGLPDGYWKAQKKKEVQELIVQCSGLFMDITTAEQFAVQTDSLRFNFAFNNRLGSSISLEKIILDQFDSSFTRQLEKNRNFGFSKTLYIPANKPITQPYWLEKKMKEGYFDVTNQLLIGQPNVNTAFNAFIHLNIYGEGYIMARPVRYKFTDPVKGELYQPLVVVPPVLLEPDNTTKISKNNNQFEGTLTLTGKKKGFQTFFDGVGKEQPDEVKVTYSPDKIFFDEKNKSIPVNYSIQATRDNDYHFAVDANNGRKDLYFVGMKEIRYDHVPYITYFNRATVRNERLDLKTYGKKIGYITGAGDKVPESLEQMGYEVVLLGNKELAKNNLGQFDAIITGVRAYNTHDWMNKYYDKLMKYVQEGGNLIVQYNTSNNIGPVKAKIGPFPFNITRTRVTDETAAVNILKPEHPVFNFPNKIVADDFQGWIQERSIYHGADTSGKFEKLISMADPGEKADDGSLLVARYGKGWFTYTGLVFFRELPAGVPGAFRLIANLIALNKKKGF